MALWVSVFQLLCNTSLVSWLKYTSYKSAEQLQWQYSHCYSYSWCGLVNFNCWFLGLVLNIWHIASYSYVAILYGLELCTHYLYNSLTYRSNCSEQKYRHICWCYTKCTSLYFPYQDSSIILSTSWHLATVKFLR